MRKKPLLFASLAVVVLGAAGATSVFFVGSKQRRDDRSAYRVYESAVAAPLGDVRRAADDMRSRLERLRGGLRSPVVAMGDVAGWRHALGRARSEIAALDVPSFLRDVGARWIAAIDGYAAVPVLFAQAAVQGARETLARADEAFADAVRLMHVHRRRLGLGSTSELPGPAPTENS